MLASGQAQTTSSYAGERGEKTEHSVDDFHSTVLALRSALLQSRAWALSDAASSPPRWQLPWSGGRRVPANDFRFSILGDRTGDAQPGVYERVWQRTGGGRILISSSTSATPSKAATTRRRLPNGSRFVRCGIAIAYPHVFHAWQSRYLVAGLAQNLRTTNPTPGVLQFQLSKRALHGAR